MNVTYLVIVKRNALLFFLFCCFSHFGYSQIYVSTKGSDSNPGTIQRPVQTLEAARDRARTSGTKEIWIRGGRYTVDKTVVFDGKDAGLKVSGYKDEDVIFDGAAYIPPNDFKVVTDSKSVQKLHSKAKGKVFAATIKDKELRELLASLTSKISMNDTPMFVSRFPNIGYSHIIHSTMSGDQIKAEGTPAAPKGPRFRIQEKFDTKKWSAELKRTKRAYIEGYYSADWLKESSPIAKVQLDEFIKITNGSQYGTGERRRKKINRIYVKQLLCEVDTEGEWYFDPSDNKLYVYPFGNKITKDSKIGIWAGPEFISINKTSNVRIENLTVQHLGQGRNGQGAISIRDSKRCELAGLTIKNTAAPLSPANIYNGESNGMRSIDFFDNERAIRCYGGEVTSTSITHGKNYVVNCHFAQINTRDFYGKAAALNGAGNIFRNNLVHNSNGQPITHAGNEHVFELNEVFNVGIEEGDGGAFYTGNRLWSHGNIFKHNFVHHIMNVPGLIERSAFFSDDQDAGDIYTQNIIYKGGGTAIKMNGGHGHTVTGNILLDGQNGIRNGNDSNRKRQSYIKSMEYIQNGNAKAGNKDNYIGRMLRDIGVKGWENGLTVDNWNERIEPFWYKRYPKLKIAMDKYKTFKAMDPFESRFYDNLFWSNDNNIVKSKASERGNRNVNISMFKDLNSLNFAYSGKRPSYAPNIPFNKIGLYKDKYRCSVPDKTKYRRAIQSRFRNQESRGRGKYDPQTINSRLYYNTGKLLLDATPCNKGGGTETENEITEYKYDLGTDNSPVFKGYRRLTDKQYKTAANSFGWTKKTGIQAVDRGKIKGVNTLNQDFISIKSNIGFQHKVKGGTWYVLVTWGDAKADLDKLRIITEGKTQKRVDFVKAKNFTNTGLTVDVKDGTLNLNFINDGGPLRNGLAVTRIVLRKVDGNKKLDELPGDTGQITLYPNPAKRYFNLDIALDTESIAPIRMALYDSTGRTVSTQSVAPGTSRIDTSQLSTGVYFVKLNAPGLSKVLRFVKE